MTETIREKINAGQPLVTVLMRFPEPSIAELIAAVGVDLITIDNEHMAFNDESIVNILRAAALHGAACMVRPADHNPKVICRLLDMGVAGILAAHVDTGDQARALVDAVKFPPLGKRGMMPISRAAGFGLHESAADYAARSNRDTVIVAMCESRTGVENIDDILAVDGIDGIAVGPSDIANSYEMPGQVQHPMIVKIIDDIRDKAFAADKLVSALVKSPEEALEAVRNGFRYINAGSDLSFIVDGAKKYSELDFSDALK